MIHVYLLDPANCVVTTESVVFREFGSGLKSLLGASGAARTRYDDHHSLFFDDRGLCDGITAYTLFDGFPEPLCGRLVIAPNALSSVAAPLIAVDQVLRRCRCHRVVMDPVIETIKVVEGEVQHFISRVTGFTPRVERISLRTA